MSSDIRKNIRQARKLRRKKIESALAILFSILSLFILFWLFGTEDGRDFAMGVLKSIMEAEGRNVGLGAY